MITIAKVHNAKKRQVLRLLCRNRNQKSYDNKSPHHWSRISKRTNVVGHEKQDRWAVSTREVWRHPLLLIFTNYADVLLTNRLISPGHSRGIVGDTKLSFAVENDDAPVAVHTLF